MVEPTPDTESVNGPVSTAAGDRQAWPYVVILARIVIAFGAAANVYAV